MHRLFEGLLRGDRGVLSRCITLVESRLPRDRAEAGHLLDLLARHGRDRDRSSFRLGVCGPPGAGKSTLIESLGRVALERGRRVAVLPVDPSSSVSGGSILGDKLRMPFLSSCEEAFVRVLALVDRLNVMRSRPLRARPTSGASLRPPSR